MRICISERIKKRSCTSITSYGGFMFSAQGKVAVRPVARQKKKRRLGNSRCHP